VARLGEVLANKLSSVTSAYRQGFGSFIDKEAMPFVTVVPGRYEIVFSPSSDLSLSETP